jgi:hypothetical protein
MNYSQQVFKILSSKLKANRRNLLINGMLSYMILMIIMIMNPTLLKYVFELSSMDENVVNSIILIGVCIAYTLNITFGSYKIIISFIRKKREYLLMPFDTLPKLHSIYYFTFIWIILNTVITIILTILILTIIGFKEEIVIISELYQPIWNEIVKMGDKIYRYGITIFFIIISVISAEIIITFFKKEKRAIGNVFRVLGVTVLFSYSMDFLIRAVSELEYSEEIKLIIISSITALILTLIAHIIAFKISVKE